VNLPFHLHLCTASLTPCHWPVPLLPPGTRAHERRIRLSDSPPVLSSFYFYLFKFFRTNGNLGGVFLCRASPGKCLPLGSDFPVEGINPLLGFYAAVARRSPEGTSPHGPGGWCVFLSLSLSLPPKLLTYLSHHITGTGVAIVIAITILA